MVKFDTSTGQEEVNNPRLRPLWHDMVECERLLEGNDTQFARRTFCRAAFAFMEGQIHWLKDIAIRVVVSEGVKQGNIQGSLISVLLDYTPRVEKNGKLKLEPNRTPFTNTVALVFRTLADKLSLDPNTFFSNVNWGRLQNALSVRHRVTHPKSATDMDITDDNMADIRGGLTWLIERLEDISKTQAQTAFDDNVANQ